MAATSSTATAQLGLIQFALHALATPAIGARFSPEEKQVLRHHLMLQCRATPDAQAADFVLAAAEVFRTGADTDSLVGAWNVFIQDNLALRDADPSRARLGSIRSLEELILPGDAGSVRASTAGHMQPLTLVYFAPEFADVAAALTHGPAARHVRLRAVDWKQFPDGWPNLFVHDIKDCRLHSVVFLASLHGTTELMMQLSVMYTLPSFARRLSVIIPYYPTGTMERVTEIGEVATAKTLARMLSATPSASTGPTAFTIFDIHALQEQFYFSDAVHVRLKSCVGLLVDRLLRLPDAARVAVAFPDEGAYKRFHGKLGVFGEAIVCTKRRDGAARRVVINDGDPAGRHCVIVDDLVQTGGTILECARALRDAGAAAVSAFCTHAVFPRESWRRFLSPPAHATAAAAVSPAAAAAEVGEGGGAAAPAAGGSGALLDFFFVTDSIPTTAATLRAAGAPFEVLSIAPVVEDIVLGL